jgi:hypothetical protein
MITVEFTHQITRESNGSEFFPGADPSDQLTADYAYLMNLINNGFNGIVNITHNETEFTWSNSFTCSADEFQSFKDAVANDTEFVRIMHIGYQYNLQNNLTETIKVVFKDENGNIIEESDAF